MSPTSRPPKHNDGKRLKLAIAAAALGMSIGVDPVTTLAAVAPGDETAGPVASKQAEAGHRQVADLRPANPDVRYFKWARPPATSMKYNQPAMQPQKFKQIKQRKK